MSETDITLLGAFPPPLGGASKNNQVLYDDLLALGMPARRVDIGGGALSHSRGATYHLRRVQAIANAAVKLAMRGGTILYAVPDGGLGVWYSLALLFVGRIKFRRLVIHHRTFQYVDKKTAAMAAIVSLASRNTTHVFLSPSMASLFQAVYGEVPHIICTNARYVRSQVTTEHLHRLKSRIVLGHLSNLCREKGFYDAVETFESILERGLDAEFRIAGPAVDVGVMERIDALRFAHPGRVTYHGPLSGFAKSEFYDSLDVFLFPTNFAQEAAPNVIYEAFAAGVPVIAKRRGCIGELVGDGRGLVVENRQNYPQLAAEEIVRMRFDPASRQERSACISSWLTAAICESEGQHKALLRLLDVPETIRDRGHV